MTKICILDYGVGNIHSAMKAFRRFNSDVTLTEDRNDLRQAHAIVLPGVGAFGAGMEGLRARGLVDVIRERAEAGIPILGICLGAQLLLSRGFEFGECEGLNIISGDVIHFPKIPERVPHMGWNSLTKAAPWNETVLDGLEEGSEVYFVHSYIMEPKSVEHVLATTEYGGQRFASVVRRGSVYGTQFHPEKSGETGLKIVGNFVRLVNCRKNPNAIHCD